MRIIQSPQFRQDTDEAWDHLAAYDLAVADAFVEALAEKLLGLARFPNLGRARPELGPDLRSFVLDRYVIYYRLVDEGIEAVRLFHSARDPDTL